MNNASSALKVAAGIFLTIALITIVVILFVSAQEATKTAQNSFSDIQTELSQASFTVYDDTTVSGSQVTNALRKFKDRDQFGIMVKTGKNSGGEWYGDVLIINEPETSERYGSVNGQSYAAISDAWNERLNEYVNPSGKFKAKVVKDSSNVVRGLIFTQTTLIP
ncbi:MAG: ABC transporter permease [Paenibacillaceae bacterium]|uniref:ABC transporter permease n=1 Tax=Paenibacillus mellifer TaxID=2937794 RepID=A0A9X1XXQ7_9BACL|nr:ABC transporter permease [Paenibacillus mellifer]MBW4838752.1 ABC transporter permease [Paenibacillaceae bacterium]MCK8486823.1 ABC transporter permease [Paenibacillus mellifer]